MSKLPAEKAAEYSERLVKAGLKARKMREHLGKTFLACEEIIEVMRALREKPLPGRSSPITLEAETTEALPGAKLEAEQTSLTPLELPDS